VSADDGRSENADSSNGYDNERRLGGGADRGVRAIYMATVRYDDDDDRIKIEIVKELLKSV